VTIFFYKKIAIKDDRTLLRKLYLKKYKLDFTQMHINDHLITDNNKLIETGSGESLDPTACEEFSGTHFIRH
jgi:hypothetical protein